MWRYKKFPKGPQTQVQQKIHWISKLFIYTHILRHKSNKTQEFEKLEASFFADEILGKTLIITSYNYQFCKFMAKAHKGFGSLLLELYPNRTSHLDFCQKQMCLSFEYSFLPGIPRIPFRRK